jgi:hypothetical protein
LYSGELGGLLIFFLKRKNNNKKNRHSTPQKPYEKRASKPLWQYKEAIILSFTSKH